MTKQTFEYGLDLSFDLKGSDALTHGTKLWLTRARITDDPVGDLISAVKQPWEIFTARHFISLAWRRYQNFIDRHLSGAEELAR